MKICYWGQSLSGSPGLSRDAAAGGETVFEDVTDETGEDGVLSATVWQIPSHPALGSLLLLDAIVVLRMKCKKSAQVVKCQIVLFSASSRLNSESR